VSPFVVEGPIGLYEPSDQEPYHSTGSGLIGVHCSCFILRSKVAFMSFKRGFAP
jgi:hypothetical protein